MAKLNLYYPIIMDPLFDAVVTMINRDTAFKAAVSDIIEREKNNGLVLENGVYHLSDSILELYYSSVEPVFPITIPQKANDNKPTPKPPERH